MAPQARVGAGRATNAAARRSCRPDARRPHATAAASFLCLAGPPPQWPRHASLAARCRRPRLRVLAVASSKVRGGGGGGSSVPASEQQHEHGGQPPQQDQPAVLPPPQQAPAEAAQERAAAPAAAAAPAWLTGRNLAFAGSAVTILLLTVFRKEIAPVS